MAKIGTRQTERFDDLAAEEINELEGVLVLDRQAHEELGESAFSFIRSAEFAKCAAFFC